LIKRRTEEALPPTSSGRHRHCRPFTYNITNVNSGYLVGVSNDSLTEGEAIVQWASDGTSSQQWVFVPTN
jgi:hypothetical protein